MMYVTAVFYFLSATTAHFVLQSPANIGFDDNLEIQAPCGSFDATNRSVVTQYPVGGAPLSILTTDNAMSVTINIAPASAAKNLASGANVTSKVMSLKVKGTGTFCLPAVPVSASLAGQDGIMQVIADGGDGIHYQCAAIKFAPGKSKAAGANCKNSTGVTVTRDAGGGTQVGGNNGAGGKGGGAQGGGAQNGGAQSGGAQNLTHNHGH